MVYVHNWDPCGKPSKHVAYKPPVNMLCERRLEEQWTLVLDGVEIDRKCKCLKIFNLLQQRR